MKKSAKFLGIFLGLGLCLTAGSTLAYFTDSDSVLNKVRVGYHETTIVEEFPDPPKIPPGEEIQIPKKVSVLNPDAEGNTDCYVRVRLLYSNSDLGSHVSLPDLDLTNWKLRPDGYFYYLHKVPTGSTTSPLFTYLSIDLKNAIESTYWYDKNLDVTVYEESIEAVDFADYESAWRFYLKDAWV